MSATGMRSTCQAHARYEPDCAACRVRRREYQAAYRLAQTAKCANCQKRWHDECRTDDCGCSATIHRRRPGFGRAAPVAAPAPPPEPPPVAKPDPEPPPVAKPDPEPPPVAKPDPEPRAPRAARPRRPAPGPEPAPAEQYASRTPSAARSKELAAQLNLLRRMETTSPVYREMLAAAEVRHAAPPGIGADGLTGPSGKRRSTPARSPSPARPRDSRRPGPQRRVGR